MPKAIKLATTRALHEGWKFERDLKAEIGRGPQRSEPIIERLRERMSAIRAAMLVNLHAVSAAVDAANGRASAHMYTASDVYAIAEGVERQLSLSGVQIKARAGATVRAMSAAPTSKSYARRARQARATLVELRRGTSAWYLVGVAAIDRYAGPSGGERIRIEIPDAAREAVIKHALAPYATT